MMSFRYIQWKFIYYEPLRNMSKLNIQETLHMINISTIDKQIRIIGKQYWSTITTNMI